MKRESITYILTGLCAVGTDYGTYMLMRMFIPVAAAKAISYILGMFVAFVLNRTFTFKSTSKAHVDLIRFVIVYMCSLLLNVSTNHVALFLFPTYVTASFAVATSVSIVTNYLGQKFWVFTKRDSHSIKL